MGQKSNFLTLRKSKLNSNLLTSNSKEFLYGLTFLKSLNSLLSKKNIIIVKNDLNFESNKLFLNISLFFRTAKLLSYSDKLKNTNLLNKFKFDNLFSLIKGHFYILNNNFIQFSFINLNNYIEKRSSIFFFNKLRRFYPLLFTRRFNLFIDFIKLSCLFDQNKVNSKVYLTLIGQIFKILPKRKHNIFFIFLKTIFTVFIKKKSLLGVKLLINGRLKGKPRSSPISFLFGSTPVQSLSKNIEFSKLHVYTLNGVFGFKFWVYR
jgi:hypothetical protein|tara:strand:- start:17365 stop:18153 length:789 start_codon:yes stop_codon:yes gene_type:complete